MAAKSRKAKPQTQVITPGSTIRFEEPSSSRQQRPNVVVVASDEVVGGFVNFLREHAVVGVAIGFIIGLQAQDLVKLLVSSFINPTFTLLFGEALSKRDFTWHFHSHTGHFGWGAFVYGLLNFLFVLAAIYFIVKFFKLDKLDKPKEEKKK